MNTLIIGGAGFVGSEIVKQWNFKEHGKLIILDKNVGKISTMSVSYPNYQFICGEASDINLLITILEENSVSRLIHLAANSDIQGGSETTNPDFQDTLKTTIALVELLQFYPIKKVYFSSTSAVYGQTNEPISEKKQLIKKPESNYGWAKLACEHMLKASSQNNLSDVIIVRFPNVVGPVPTHGILFDFKNKLKKNPEFLEVLGNGTQEKPYIHVFDLTKVLLGMIELENTTSNVSMQYLNIGPGDTITVKDIVDEVLKITKLNPKISWGSTPQGWQGDIAKYNYINEIPSELSKIQIRNSSTAVRDSFKEAWENE